MGAGKIQKTTHRQIRLESKHLKDKAIHHVYRRKKKRKGDPEYESEFPEEEEETQWIWYLVANCPHQTINKTYRMGMRNHPKTTQLSIVPYQWV